MLKIKIINANILLLNIEIIIFKELLINTYKHIKKLLYILNINVLILNIKIIIYIYIYF